MDTNIQQKFTNTEMVSTKFKTAVTETRGELGHAIAGQGHTEVYEHIFHVLPFTYLKQKWQNAEPCQR